VSARKPDRNAIEKQFQAALMRLGYDVTLGEVVAEGQAADLVATKGNDKLVVEVEAVDVLPEHIFYHARSLKKQLSAPYQSYTSTRVIVGTTAPLDEVEKASFRKGDIYVMSAGNTVEETTENFRNLLDL
jgi:hypothetical protein